MNRQPYRGLEKLGESGLDLIDADSHAGPDNQKMTYTTHGALITSETARDHILRATVSSPMAFLKIVVTHDLPRDHFSLGRKRAQAL
jgi:hypothetical protein